MNSGDIGFYNSYFSDHKDFSLIQGFNTDKEAEIYLGIVSFKIKNKSFILSVEIPYSYPIGDLKFYFKKETGFSHQNYDGSFCLNTEYTNHLYTRLNLEIEKLKGWFLNYYFSENNDDHFEYAAINIKSKIYLLFNEGQYNGTLKKGEYGIFEYLVMSEFSNPETKKSNGFTCKISKFLTQNIEIYKKEQLSKKKNYKGIWYFLEQEPVLINRTRFERWKELKGILSEEFMEYFIHFNHNNAGYKLTPQRHPISILLLLGYLIPTNSRGTEEIHWDLIELERSKFSRKFNFGVENIFLNNFELKWAKTENYHPTRFFGRGGLARTFCDKKILIIGIGAIGSKIAEVLVRGGVKIIGISDIDRIAPGNICRSIYSFVSTGSPKSLQLKFILEDISPHLEVKLEEILPVTELNKSYREMLETLDNYDLIFDCSANNQILQILSDAIIKANVYHVSMTDRAKEMIFISKKDNLDLVERRNQLLYSFGSFKEATFREGTGCWHPTFEASYFDINSILNPGISYLNSISTNDQNYKSFFIKSSNNCISLSYDNLYYQPEVKLYLRIESHVMDEIYMLIDKHYPNEFGGSLIGSYINKYREIVVSRIIYPENFKHSHFNFTPDNIEISNQLKKINSKFEGVLEFIGDWHSHPNGSNGFSGADFKSIKKVAISEQVSIANPILLIVSFNGKNYEPAFYVFKDDMLHKYNALDNYKDLP